MSQGSAKKDFRSTHHRELVMIIRGALEFGGQVQHGRAEKALAVLRHRLDALKKVAKDNGGREIPPDELVRMVHGRLLEIVEHGFDFPAANLLKLADQALRQLQSCLDKRGKAINSGKDLVATI